MSGPVVFLRRKESFAAAHRLYNNNLSEAENLEIYGKCNSPNGHGHNYEVEITVRGPVDPRTGMVMNLIELRDYMHEIIFKNLDHKNLDKDVSFFYSTPSTTENLAIYIWDNMRAIMKQPDLLYEVKIQETDRNSVIYRGPYPAQYKIKNNRNLGNTCTNISSDSD